MSITAEPYVFRGLMLPPRLQESLNAYVAFGRPVGSFLQACIDNDLREACSRADESNLRIIPAVVAYLFNNCPLGCWGREGAHDVWIAQKQKERDRD